MNKNFVIFAVFLLHCTSDSQTESHQTTAAQQTVPQDTTADPESALWPESPDISLGFDDVLVNDAIKSLSLSTGTTIVIDAKANSIVRCAKISAYSPQPLTAEGAFSLVEEAIRPAGLSFEKNPHGYVLRRDESVAEPEECKRFAHRRFRPSFERSSPTDQSDEQAKQNNAATEKIIAGIRNTGENEYEITKSSVKALIENTNIFARSARFLPHYKNGQTVGMKLYGVRRNSIFGHLGFRNGDSILKVAGHKIDSPDNALEAYKKVRNKKNIKVRIHRRGEEIELRYKVVP